jgi:uncharacterized protein RhaS with RHS repeats
MISLQSYEPGALRVPLKSPVRENRTPGSVRGRPGNRAFLPRYNPYLGRWLSRDPIGVRGGTNYYLYNINKTTTVIDLYGLSSVELPTYAPQPVYRADPSNNPFDTALPDEGFTQWTCKVTCSCECDKITKQWLLKFKLTITPEIRLQSGMSPENTRGTYGHEQQHVLSGFDKALDFIKPQMDKSEKDFNDKNGENSDPEKACKKAALQCFGRSTIQQKCDKKLNGEGDHAGDPTATPWSPGTHDNYPLLPGSLEALTP